jgi:anthranilate phosphoribosyltransferase
LKVFLNKVLNKVSLTRVEASECAKIMARPEAVDSQVGAMLSALRSKGETVEEILGFIDFIKSNSVQIPHDYSNAIDVCGTGGDGLSTFNISTAVSFIVAASGVKVAKHGNKAVSSQSGSFDVLEALGLKFESDPLKIAKNLEKFNLAFIFAPAFHPVLKNVSRIRKELGVFTIFNLLGPLLNPANTKRQIIGVYHSKELEKLAEVALKLGLNEVMVIHGQDGLDEISLSGPTDIFHLKNKKIERLCIKPSDFGLQPAPLSEIQGGTASENAKIILRIFKGELGPRRDILLMNAAAGLVVSGLAPNFKEGFLKASHTLDSRDALNLLEKMVLGE